jgi:DNA repair exonuclease SbcCD nuclease subunit
MDNKVKIILSGDNHLGKRQYNSPIREKDFQKAWLWVCSKVAEMNPDFFIMSGDLFDKKMVDPVTMSVAVEGLSQCGQSKVVAIEGNHDGRSFIGKGRSWLEFLHEQGLVDHILRPSEPYSRYGVSLFGAPWSGMKTVEAFEAVVWEAEMFDYPHNMRIGVFHASPENYVLGTGTIPAEMLLGSKFDLILMGHCHRPFNIDDRVFCAGSPEICDISEIDNGAGIWVIDFFTDVLGHERKSSELIKYEPREFVTTSIWGDGMGIGNAACLHGPQSVVIVDVIGERRHVDFAAIKKRVEETYDPILVRVNDKMTAKAEVRPRSGPDFFDGLVTDLLDDKATIEEFKSIFDCFEDDDRDGVVPILMEVTDAK